MPQSKHQAVLLLLAARLAPSRLFPHGQDGPGRRPRGRGDWKRYVAYYQGQVRELCTNYGEIGGIWFDGWWDRPDADWDLAGTYRMIHELQPGALVGNNHHVAPMPGEDFQMFEQDLPGENAAGFNKAGIAADLPLETCLTINDSWGYNAADAHYKSAEQIILALVGAAGRGANLLLNVGPRPDGTIDPESRQRLMDVGKWLATYGDSIYGTRRGPIAPRSWGVSTAKGRKGSPDRDLSAHPQARSSDAHHPRQGDLLVDAVPVRQGPAAEADPVADRDGPHPARRRRDADRHDRHAEAPGPRALATIPGGRSMGEPTEKPARRRVDVISAMMSLVTVAAIVGAAWLRYGPKAALDREPATDVTVGEEAPPLRLLDLKTGEPLVLVGLSNRVVWVVFWSAESPSGRECLSELETVWKKLKVNRRFALVTAAVDGEDPTRPRRGRGRRRRSARLPGQPGDPAAIPRPGRGSSVARPDRRRG